MWLRKKPEFPPLVVRVVDAEPTQTTWSSRFQGEVRAQTNIELVTEVTGKVVAISNDFTEGGGFDAGETLVQIDSSDYTVALESAKAAVAEAQVAVDIETATAESRLREWKMLNKNDQQVPDAKPLQLNRPQVQQAKARLDAAKAQLDAAKLNVERTRIKAPFAGRVQTKGIGLGQFVSRGMSLGNVFASDVVEIRVPMTDTQLNELQLTMGFRADGPATSPEVKVLIVFANQQHEWQGYLKAVDASIDNETRLVYATVVVDNPYDLGDGHQVPLAPGLFVEVDINAQQALSGVRIPRDALRNGNRVYIFEDNKLLVRDVDVLVTSSLDVVVNNGLTEGEQVIISPVPSAYNGMAVEIKPATDGSDSTAEDLNPKAEGSDSTAESSVSSAESSVSSAEGSVSSAKGSESKEEGNAL